MGRVPSLKRSRLDGELRPDWWQLYDDPVLNMLEEQAMAANPDLQAAAERFIQARDIMMKVRSRRIPHVGLGFDASNNRESANHLPSPKFSMRPRFPSCDKEEAHE